MGANQILDHKLGVIQHNLHNTRKDELYKAMEEAFSAEKAEKLKNWITSLK